MTIDDKAQDLRLARQVVAGGRLRATVLELWQRTRMDWGFVTDRLSATFRKERWIGAQERRFVAETVFGLVRHFRRIDTALSRGVRRGGATRDLDRILALLVLEGGLPVAEARALAPDVDWAAVAEVDGAIAREPNPARRLALATSMPDWLAAQLVADWGDEATAVAHGLNGRAPMTVRANTLVGDRAALAAALGALGLHTHPGAWSTTALVLDTRTNLFATEPFKRGAMEAQDEGSQLLAELATPATPGIVLDYCAGAGGKTLAIAAGMAGRGRVLACDVDGKKLEELRRRARRAGVGNAQAVTLAGPGADAPPPLRAIAGRASRVLIDAPCSGVGALRRNPEARWRLTADDVTSLTRQQAEILDEALPALADGGLLVYATCSLLRRENQDVVGAVLARHLDLEEVPLVTLWPDRAAALGDGRHLLVRPDRHGTDGFFAAVLRRRPA